MDSIPLTKPSPTVQTQPTFDSEKLQAKQPSPTSPIQEFNPCSTSDPTSPFYLYKCDSPRASYDPNGLKPTKSVALQVSIKDLERGEAALTPTSTQEKSIRDSSDHGRLRLWGSRNQCMTKPKQRRCMWLHSLPGWQKVLVKLLIALVVVGTVVGVAVGVTIKVHGGVWRSPNRQGEIGN